MEDAIGLLAESEHKAKVIAGGQSLLLALKERLARPERLMSIASLLDLKGISSTSTGALSIGPMTTYAALAKVPLPGWHGEIAAVAGNLADRSVRSLGTIGGALCDASPRYDMPTLMVAADASLILASAEGERIIRAESFFDVAGGTVLKPSELLIGIHVPALAAFDGLVFEKFRHRVFDAAILTVAVAVKREADGTIANARLVVGAIAKAPSMAYLAAASMVGCRLDAIDFKALALTASEELMPRDSLNTRNRRYQAELIVSLMARALARLLNASGK